MPDLGRRLERKDAAKFLGCCEGTLNRLMKSGLLVGTYFNIGPRRIFFENKLLQWLEDGGEDGAKARLAEEAVIKKQGLNPC